MLIMVLTTILFITSLVILGITLWLIKCKDLDSRKETYEKNFWKTRYNNLEENIENLQKENRSLREELYKAKHSKFSHRVIFTNEINDEYIDEEEYKFIVDIIGRNEDRKGYIEINDNLFKIKDIDCVIKLNKE